jgi:hypothetical protein
MVWITDMPVSELYLKVHFISHLRVFFIRRLKIHGALPPLHAHSRIDALVHKYVQLYLVLGAKGDTYPNTQTRICHC